MITREFGIRILQMPKKVIYEIPFYGMLLDLRKIYVKDNRLMLEFAKLAVLKQRCATASSSEHVK